MQDATAGMYRKKYPPLTVEQHDHVYQCHAMAHWYQMRNFPALYRTYGDDIKGFVELFLCEAASIFDPLRPSKMTGKPVKFSTFLVSHLFLRLRALSEKANAKNKRFRLVPEADLIRPDQESGDSPVSTVLANEPCDVHGRRDESKLAGELLRRLPQRYRFVVEARFGFLDGNEWTLGQVADAMCLTKEAARQLELKAMRMLDRYLDSKVPAGTPL